MHSSCVIRTGRRLAQETHAVPLVRDLQLVDDPNGLAMSMCGTEALEGQSPVVMVMCFVPQSRAVSVKTDIIAHRRK